MAFPLTTHPARHTGPRRGEDLLTEAFEATQDLAFLADAHEACEFVANLVVTLLHAAGVAVMVYDIDRDELVLESTSGVKGNPGGRVPLAQGPRGESAIRNKLVLLSEPMGEDSLVSEPPSGPVLFSPVRHDRRLFGVLQIHRAANEVPFGNDEQHTVSYVAGQLAKFLADHSKRIGFKEEDHPKGR